MKQGTNGEVTVDVHPNAQLFNERSGIEALRLGTLDLCWGGLATLGNWRPEFGFIALPFIFTGFDHVKKVIYGPLGDRARADALKTLGIDVLSLGASGFRIFMGNKNIQTADDCKGIKLRVPEIPVYVEMARALGANATPIPADAIYTSLQTHVVDEMENPPDYMVDVKLWEVAKNATQTNHIFTDPNLDVECREDRLCSRRPYQRAVHAAARRSRCRSRCGPRTSNNQRQAWTVIAQKCQAISEPRPKIVPRQDGAGRARFYRQERRDREGLSRRCRSRGR